MKLVSLLSRALGLSAPDDNDDVAFQVRTTADGTMAAIFPHRTRHYRVEPEALAYLLVYPQGGKAMRYVEFHGAMRKQFGPQLRLWSVEVRGRRHDDLMRECVEDARRAIAALRDTIDATPAEDDASFPDAEPVAATSPASPTAPVVQSPSDDEPDRPTFIRTGRLLSYGTSNWVSPEGVKGRPSFCVVLEHRDKEERLWGADLQRVVRECNMQPGDMVRLEKWSKHPVRTGDRIVRKNIWRGEVLAEAGDDHSQADL